MAMPVLHWKAITVGLPRVLAEKSLADIISFAVPNMEKADRELTLASLQKQAGLDIAKKSSEPMGLRLAGMGIGVTQVKVEE